MSHDISGDSIENLLFVSYYSSDDGSSKLYLFHFYSKLRLEDLAPDGIAPLHPSSPLPSVIYVTYQIFQSLSVKYSTQHSSLYWNSSGCTSSSQCMYYQTEEGDEGGSLCGGFWRTYFWKISPVFWKPVTLWQSHWYAKSYLGSDMWNFFFHFARLLESQPQCGNVYSVRVHRKTIVCSHFPPALGYEATCVGEVMHLRWSIAIGPDLWTEYTPRQYSLSDCDRVHTHIHTPAWARCISDITEHHFKCLSAPPSPQT